MAACSPDALDLLRKGFLTCLPDKELCLYRLVAKLLAGWPRFLRNFSDETMYPILSAVRHLNGEAHLFKGFVRFSELGGVLGSEIEPKNRVLPLLRKHFVPDIKTKPFSSMTAPTGKRCFMQPESPQSAPWRSFIWRRQMKRKPATAFSGNASMIPLPFQSVKTLNAG